MDLSNSNDETLSPSPRKFMKPAMSVRRRNSTSIIFHVVEETVEDKIDQETEPNQNTTWVHAKGGWVIHIVVILFLKTLFNITPGITTDSSWTLTNVSYVFGTYVMFHFIKGVPFELNSGAYDHLTMWEQMDEGAHYTPSKKFFVGVPIALFLTTTHFTGYDTKWFVINLLVCCLAVAPKLPILDRVRISLL